MALALAVAVAVPAALQAQAQAQAQAQGLALLALQFCAPPVGASRPAWAPPLCSWQLCSSSWRRLQRQRPGSFSRACLQQLRMSSGTVFSAAPAASLEGALERAVRAEEAQSLAQARRPQLCCARSCRVLQRSWLLQQASQRRALQRLPRLQQLQLQRLLLLLWPWAWSWALAWPQEALAAPLLCAPPPWALPCALLWLRPGTPLCPPQQEPAAAVAVAGQQWQLWAPPPCAL